MLAVMYFLIIFFLAFNTFCCLYLWALAMRGLKVKRPARSVKFNRFAVLVPVHNEEAVIEDLLASLNGLTYPKDMYECQFVADHCSDGTVAKTRSAGFVCHEKNDGLPGKGKALSWLTAKVLGSSEKRYDAVVYFDADDRVDSDFLSVVNDSLNEGSAVIQGNSNILNHGDSVFAAVNHINVLATNRFKENGRKNAGLSCNLRGHAMCFRIDVLDEFDWAHNSLVEDEELLLRLILGGKKVVWEHTAVVDNRMPETMASARKQRMRWSRGKIQLMRDRWPAMVKNIITHPSWQACDGFIMLVMPTCSILVGLAILTWLASIAILSHVPGLFVWSSVLVAAYFIYFLTAALLEKVNPKMILYFLISPFFVFWRMGIYAVSAVKMKSMEWK